MIPTSTLRSHLAKSCTWESVISYSGYKYNSSNSKSHNRDGHGDSDCSQDHRIWFYMPSGEEVSYCAHAAMAACSVINNIEQSNHGSSSKVKGKTKFAFLTGIIGDEAEQNEHNFELIENSAKVCRDEKNLLNEVTLRMSSLLQEEDVHQDRVLKLLEQVGLSIKDVLVDDIGKNQKFPCFINSSVARNKTLIPLKSISTLHSAQNPKDEYLFRDLCDDIDSTGLYLYAPTSLSSYECRQFPRFSGYPEDPATGIAAAALANSLYSRGIHETNNNHKDSNKDGVEYDFFQGTAMKKPSKIKISFRKHDQDALNSLILNCSGYVEVDEMDEIELPQL